MQSGLINRGTSFLWVMVRLNVMFLVSNLPLIVVLLVMPLHIVSLPLYVLGALFLGPSLLALFLVLKRYDETNQVSLLPLYIGCYKEELKGSFAFIASYVFGALVLFGAYIGLQFSPVAVPIVPVYFFLAILLYVHLIFALVMRVNFVVGIGGTWRLGLYCISKYPLHALFIFGGTLIFGAIINMFPLVVALGIVPMLGYLVTKATERIVREVTIELKINQEGEKK